MDEVQELLEQARALGRSIADHAHVQAFMTARKKVDNDADAQRLLKEYSAQARHIRELEVQQRPVEVADKQKLARCEQQMASNDALKELMRAQADYVALMNQVNRAMEEPLAGPQQQGAGP